MSSRRLILASLLTLACSTGRVGAPTTAPTLLGTWHDDYGSSYVISDTLLVHQPRSRYRIVEWHRAEQFLIAQNAADHPSDPGLWTRLDWRRFEGMPPYTWGFCLTAYRAPSAEAARATPPADRANPRTGCNGHPLTRMRPGDGTATGAY